MEDTNTVNVQTPNPKPQAVTIVLVTLLILSFGLTVFLYYQNQKLQRQITKLSVQPTPTPISDPAANWKTYTNGKYAFNFKYPSNITFTENTAGHNQSVVELNWYQADPYFEFGFQLTPMSPKDLVSLTIGSRGNTEETINIDGLKATKLMANGGDGGSVKQSVIYFTKDKLTYYFFTGGNPELTNQILSTFKFTDMSNWKTYIENDFSFKYPSNMEVESSSEKNVFYLSTINFTSSDATAYKVQISKILNPVESLEQLVKVTPNTPEESATDKQSIQTINGNSMAISTYKDSWSVYKKYFVYSPKLAIIFQGTGKNHATLDQILSTFKFIK